MEIKIKKENKGKRLDVFLSEYLPDLSRNYVQNLIKLKSISVNGKEIRANYRLKEKDVVNVNLPNKKIVQLKAQEIPINIIYEDDDILVINKPSGIVVHPSFGHEEGTLVNAILAHCKDLSVINGEIRPGIIHRLDKDTSGLLIVAKNNKSMTNLARQIEKRQVVKKYLLLIKGRLEPEKGTIELPMKRSLKDRKKIAVRSDGKYAKTEYIVKDYFKGYSLVKAQLITGRTHQLRVHFSFLGYPIVGDKTYGWRNTENLKLDRQFLHAYYLKFKHPKTGKWIEFRSGLPENLEKILERIRKRS